MTLKNQENDSELRFVFDFSLTMFSVALGFSIYLASEVAGLFLPSNIFVYGKFEKTAVTTLIYFVFMFINIFAFALCWYYRRSQFAKKILDWDRHTSLFRFIWRIFLATAGGLSPYWFSYLLTYIIARALGISPT